MKVSNGMDRQKSYEITSILNNCSKEREALTYGQWTYGQSNVKWTLRTYVCNFIHVGIFERLCHEFVYNHLSFQGSTIVTSEGWR